MERDLRGWSHVSTPVAITRAVRVHVTGRARSVASTTSCHRRGTSSSPAGRAPFTRRQQTRSYDDQVAAQSVSRPPSSTRKAVPAESTDVEERTALLALTTSAPSRPRPQPAHPSTARRSVRV
ncbi:hypothetical protein MRX96_059043 [Rhipicephalus microplus]